MKLRSLIVVVFLALTSVGAHAEVGLYLGPIFTRVSNSTLDTGNFSFLGATSTARWFKGINIGGYYDFMQSNGVSLGLDARDSIVNGNGATLNSFTVGARIAYQPKTSRFKPYVEPFFGAGTSRSPNTELHVSKAEYGVFVGTDYKISRRVNFRVVELGYGSVITASDGTIGGTQGVPKCSLLSLGTGLVFHF